VFKIVNIGFVVSDAQTPDTELNFEVQVVDYDGDTTATQTLTIDILGDASAAALLSSATDLLLL
jgi:hypothetical protein